VHSGAAGIGAAHAGLRPGNRSHRPDQLGTEWPDTIESVERHVLPLLRKHKVRYVQVSRAGPLEADGIVVHSDSREPERLFHEGAYRLEDELLENGTLPTFDPDRGHVCAVKHKGWPLSRFLEQALGSSPYTHVLGFNASETRRIDRDRGYAVGARQVDYPLHRWGWDRGRCSDYLREVFGAEWERSACGFCPWAGGKRPVLQRMRDFPAVAAHAAYLEYVSLALNPKVGLYPRSLPLRVLLERDGNRAALDLLDQRLAADRWSVVRVRRVYFGPKTADREVKRVHEGSRVECGAELARIAVRNGCEIVPRGSSLAVATLVRTGERGPEETFVLVPAVVRDKARPRFPRVWEKARELDLFPAAA
jgi:hypothetical protein